MGTWGEKPWGSGPPRTAAAVVAFSLLLAGACGGGSGRGAEPSAPVTTEPAPTSASPSLAPPPHVRLSLVATVDQPVSMALRPGDDALYVVGKAGRVWALRDGRIDRPPVLDLTGQVSDGNEQGLLGLAFDPSGAFAYVHYTDPRGDIHVDEYAWSDGRMDPSTQRRILFLRKQFPNHNGGQLAFGPDGYLYVAIGDGGSDYTFGDPQGDPYRNGQNVRVLFGKLLRIEPRMPDGSLPPGGAPYAIPPDNPFVDRARARPEIWAYGLRNPWRFSFDTETEDLWIGDVGAGAREEIDLQPAGSAGGQNYGWNVLEGTVVYRNPPPGAVPPVYEYPHTAGGCAVIGGYVYRGAEVPSLQGWYVFGDACLGTIDALQMTAEDRRVYVASGDGAPQLSSFGQDQAGELYALSLEGGIYRLEA
jgi:glucose/arabinose dehydrogenase